ncbi:ArsB/NhaD family transporter [Paraliomyxa miuraensis]|uniref:SLC13 family permease n=1 Tax=Paraliomyxa miuraensis TaxID=376150 RepID=UPI00225B0C1D|nr:SLC13 family permease [Paraliomyxa miuraensis]MCX4242803.1 SLC13 family permease [Paraliomyxa miuraensis]
MQSLGVVLFAITYAVISARRLRWLPLDRPAGALLGAVACVATGAVGTSEALAAIDGATLLLLFGVMGMGAFLARDGFFEDAERWLVARARTPARLLGWVVWGAGGLSALITNDAVCVLVAPLLVRMIQRHRLPALPFLLALSTAANTGSVATLVGNPQNMLCGLLGELPFGIFLLHMAPVAVIGLAIDHALLWLLFRGVLAERGLEAADSEPVASHGRWWITVAVLGATSIAYVVGAPLAWTAVSGFALLTVLHRTDTRALWSTIDWSLLVFFAGLFVVVQALVDSGAPAWVFARVPLQVEAGDPAGLLASAGIFVAGSNLVSNVPFILVVRQPLEALADPTLAWELLAMSSTFAGNLTLLGSVANVIVAEAGREVGGIGFFSFLRIGVPLTLLTTLAGVGWLLLVT